MDKLQFLLNILDFWRFMAYDFIITDDVLHDNGKPVGKAGTQN